MSTILTCLLTAQADPQRGTHLDSDVELLRTLSDSIHRHGHTLTVLHDCLDDNDEVDTFVRVPAGGNPYFYRWRVIHDWLASNTLDTDRVWCVDGTDVEMLHDPFPHMEPSIVYSGSESGWPLGWLRSHCRSRQRWYRRNQHRPFLNMGILGGQRTDIIDAARQLAESEADGDDWEIGAWQQIAWQTFGERVVTGEPVHTKFTAHDSEHPTAWWSHK